MIESRAPAQGGPGRNGLREFVRFVVRRKLIILATTVLIPAATWAFVSTIPHRYTAEAALALDARKVQIVEHEVVSGLPQESPVVRTELDVIASRSLIGKVIDRLDLMHDPGFLKEAEARSSPLRNLLGAIQDGVSRLLPGTALIGSADVDHAVPTLTRSQLTDWLIDHLKVSNDGRSFTIIVSFTSQDPKEAARITNAIAEQYLADQVETKATATARANKWLAEKLTDLRHQVEASDAAVDNFRRQSGLIEAKGETVPAQRLVAINSQLINARLARAQAEAKLQAARDGDPSTAPAVLASPIVQELQKQIALNNAKIAEEKYNSLSYKSSVLRARAAALRKQLHMETNRILASLSAEVRAARQNEAGLTRSLQNVEAQLGGTTRLSQLKLEADADRSVYETFLARYKETMEQGGLEAPDARLISQAAPPSIPSYPKKLELVVLAAFAGLALGVGLGYVRESFDGRIRQASDVGAFVGIPVFGLIPRLSRWRLLAPQDYPVSKPHSQFCTSLVRIHTALQAPGSPGCKVIFVTSAKAGEGKTSLCTSLARSLATSLTRVLVIDADPYRPRVAAAFGAPVVPNLLAVVDNHARLSDVVQIDAKSAAHFITGPSEHGLQMLVRSGGFAALIEEARSAYDIVILDTPPVMTRPDAAVVGKFADTCLFLVRSGRTSWDEVTSAIGFLRLCGIRPDGVVMVGVDAQSAHYGQVGGYGYGPMPSADGFAPPALDRRAAAIRGSEQG